MRKTFFYSLSIAVLCSTVSQAQSVASSESSASVASFQTNSVRSGWAVFHDPTLDSLIDLGLTNNPDVRVAVSRVEEARIRVRVAESFLAPSIRSSLNFNTQSLSEYRPVAVPVTSERLPRIQLNSLQVLPIDASYEVDLFKRIRNTVRVTDLQRQVTESDVQITQLIVASEVARLFYLIRANDSEQAVIRRNIGLRDSTISIIRARFQAGLTNEIDAKRAETDIANVRVQLLGLERSRTELVNGLAGLCGQNPANFTVPAGRLGTGFPELPFSAISADQLRRRPDLLQAEQQTQVAHVQVQVNRAALYPRINLVGAGGTLTGRIGNLFFPASMTYLLGLNASVPIFEGKRNQQNIVLAQQQVRTADASYQQRMLNAQREAETALDNLQSMRQQIDAQNLALESARYTEKLNRELYTKGLTTFLEVLDSQRTVLDSERQLVLLQGQRASYTVALLKALGGSF
ncbi:efflux transporter outer membrane subunit [Larkinella terrae]|uniref:Efflux transporter outer membrane subunit n=1 Tax=Larkinella terrae TaxID=2025311 RepID=A0A7K0EIT9_9BACT|nr:efflux transporter outer membrane subunit [Larkinella terrae]MRS61727.1 efflux transporter outer membrane subunit [Larkinella terrae]